MKIKIGFVEIVELNDLELEWVLNRYGRTTTAPITEPCPVIAIVGGGGCASNEEE